jgi:hypothetical protein
MNKGVITTKTSICISLSNLTFQAKPRKSNQFTKIHNSLQKQSVSVEFFLNAINRGQSFTAAIFDKDNRTKKAFLESNMFALDFDNGKSIAEIEEILEGKTLHANIVYKTFSYTEEKPRFRVILIFDQVIKNSSAYSKILKSLVYLTKCDRTGIDISKLYLGGFNARLNHTSINKLAFIIPWVDSMGFETSPTTKTKTCSLLKPYSGEHFAKRRNKIQNFDYDVARFNSKQFDLFLSGKKHFDYKSLLNLATNLQCVNRGLEKMASAMSIRSDYMDCDFEILTSVPKYNYSPEELESFDPENSSIFRNVLELQLKTHKPVKKTNSLESSQKQLENLIEEGSGRVVKCQPGSGKTFCAVEYMMRRLEEGFHFVVAAPTFLLLDEYSKKIERKYSMQPKFEPPYFKEQHKENIAIYGGTVALKKFYQESKRKKSKCNKSKKNFDYITDYNQKVSTFYKFQDPLSLITHRQFFKHGENSSTFYDIDRIFVDEDFLLTFLQTVSISTEHFFNLEKILDDKKTRLSSKTVLSKESYFLKDFETFIIFFNSIKYNNIEPVGDLVYHNPDFFEQCMLEIPYGHLIIDLLSCKFIYKGQTGYTGIQKRKINQDVLNKTTLLSGTFDDFFYSKILDDFNLSEVPMIPNQNSIVQYTRFMFSRRQLLDLNFKLPIIPDDFKVITYKEHKDLFGKDTNCELHFGNLEGIDSVNGANLVIIGTPVPPPYITFLYAKMLGFDLCLEGMKKVSRNVVIDEFVFRMFTFSSDDLAQIEVRLARMQIEQAIGRARSIRSDCRVILYSNIPCNQTDIFEKDIPENNLYLRGKDR